MAVCFFLAANQLPPPQPEIASLVAPPFGVRWLAIHGSLAHLQGFEWPCRVLAFTLTGWNMAVPGGANPATALGACGPGTRSVESDNPNWLTAAAEDSTFVTRYAGLNETNFQTLVRLEYAVRYPLSTPHESARLLQDLETFWLPRANGPGGALIPGDFQGQAAVREIRAL